MLPLVFVAHILQPDPLALKFDKEEGWYGENCRRSTFLRTFLNGLERHSLQVKRKPFIMTALTLGKI